jgi:hypothetical protein
LGIGGCAAEWFARYDLTLKSQLKISLENAFLEQRDRFYSFNDSELGVDADLAILPHPSGQNAKLWRRLGYEHRRETIAIFESLRKAVAGILLKME